jgi:antitoxin ParD1/3/4
MNVSLPKDLRDWLNDQVEAGGYGTASEYLRDMLRRARAREARRRLDEMLVEAVESGATIEMNDSDWASVRKAAKAASAKAHKSKR